MRYKLSSASIEEQFPDWDTLDLGEWSKYEVKLEYQPGLYLEVGLYREPEDSGEDAGTYTLQACDGEGVIFCETVGRMEEQK